MQLSSQSPKNKLSSPHISIKNYLQFKPWECSVMEMKYYPFIDHLLSSLIQC